MNPDDLADLEEQRAFLVRSLDDLDRELAAGDIDGLDASTLHDDYTHRLAEVQRRIESGQSAIREQLPPRRRARSAAVVAAVALLAVGAGVAVANAAGSRKPGETATGSIRQFSVDKLTEAAALQDEGRYVEALKRYDEVIAADPGNAEALAERGFLLLKLKDVDPEFLPSGRDYIERALAIEPHNPQWLVYRAMGLNLAGDEPAAQRAIDEALANDPPAGLRAAIEAIRKSLATTKPTTKP